PAQTGTKVAALYTLTIGAGETQTIHLRLTSLTPTQLGDTPLAEFEATLAARLAEADAFYRTIIPCSLDADSAQIIRQALAGMLWSKQYYFYEVDRWLPERVTELAQVPRRRRLLSRNSQWYHMVNAHIISMPDKWEYPWYAAWDLAFHTVALDMVDPDFARQQLDLMLREYYLHPNGQLPAYEWNFGDVNPPVHAWAAHYIHQTETIAAGSVDFDWLKHAFQKLLLNFTWWVNRKDPGGRNVFEGGFLGLDNIGVFDRSAPLPTGGYLEQADGTAWMALFSQNMLQIALELAQIDEVYADMSAKFFEHFLWIASAMDCIGDNEDEMWDEADGFFYDLLRLPNGQAMRLKVRSLVGLLPLCASTVIGPALLEKLPQLRERARWFVKYYPDLIANIHNPLKPGYGGCYLLSILNEDKLRRVLARMLDEKEFLSPYGIRSVSLYHAQQPYVFYWDDQEYRVDYLPAESNNGMFGGNSNWRGPIWMPINTLLVRALANLYVYYGDDFRVECPTGSGRLMTLFQVAEELTQRLASIFRRNSEGRRPVYGDTRKFQEDPHWRDYLLFYEYFHGDNGAGLGASHQTGWTGVIAKLLQFFSSNGGQEVLNRTYGSSAGPE
ncbi:MAG TPA: glucosidase, partial [Anaerolineae bacterium]|nr:glucosidase [Anaerolineae bacterium]